MKSKEVKNSVSPSQGQVQAKASLGVVKDEPGSGGQSPPSIKSDPDAPPTVNGENNVGGGANNNCDNSGGTPPTPGTEAAERDASTPSSLGEDKKPVIPGSGPPSNCNTGNGLIKSETDFLDTFDSKDGGEMFIPFCQSVNQEVDLGSR